MSLNQLIYTSVATRDFSDEELADILRTAVRNNQQRGVTGLLLYSHGSFMQVIEGEAAVIDALIAAIKTDPRHHGIEEQLRTQIQEREFDQWHMGFRAMNEADALALPHYAAFFEDGFNDQMLAAKPGICLEIMRALAGLPR
jgi:hypothetical protein